MGVDKTLSFGSYLNDDGRLPVEAQVVAIVTLPTGSAGTPNAAVLTVQGIAGGTPQPVSGTFYQATQPTSDAGPAWVSVRGVGGVPFTSADASGSTPAYCTDAPTSGQKLVISDILLSTDTTMWVKLLEETSGTVLAGPFYMSANSVVQITPRGKFKLPTADKRLRILSSIAGNLMATVYYYSEA